MKNLEIEPLASNDDNDNQTDNIDEILKIYEKHPSILKIKENVNVENTFIFTDTNPNAIKVEISKLDPKKASVENDIPTKNID